jgi:hypothetical protein
VMPPDLLPASVPTAVAVPSAAQQQDHQQNY